MTDLLLAPPAIPIAVEHARPGYDFRGVESDEAWMPTTVAPTAPAAAEVEPLNLTAVALSTCALMTAFMFSWVTLAMYLAMGDLVGAIGVGAFCAVWGGPGFGAVATGVRFARHAERSEH